MTDLNKKIEKIIEKNSSDFDEMNGASRELATRQILSTVYKHLEKKLPKERENNALMGSEMAIRIHQRNKDLSDIKQLLREELLINSKNDK